jgi:hypothetical protein
MSGHPGFRLNHSDPPPIRLLDAHGPVLAARGRTEFEVLMLRPAGRLAAVFSAVAMLLPLATPANADGLPRFATQNICVQSRVKPVWNVPKAVRTWNQQHVVHLTLRKSCQGRKQRLVVTQYHGAKKGDHGEGWFETVKFSRSGRSLWVNLHLNLYVIAGWNKEAPWLPHQALACYLSSGSTGMLGSALGLPSVPMSRHAIMSDPQPMRVQGRCGRLTKLDVRLLRRTYRH